MLSKGEFGRSYCGGCIGSKKQDRMCIKRNCTVASHKSNLWTFVTSSVSSSERYVFIGVKDRVDLVWTATTLPYETIESSWGVVGKDRRPIAQWQNFFDRVRGADESGEHVEMALQASAEAAASIRTKGAISPSKRLHAEISPSTGLGVNIVGQALLEKFQDALQETDQGKLDVNDVHMSLLRDYNKRLRV